VKNLSKKVLIASILGLVCIFAVSGQSNAANLDEAIQQSAREMSLRFAMGPRVAVLNFASPSNDLSTYVVREMTSALERARTSTLISRQDIDRALGGMNLTLSGEITEANARQLGRNLNAGFVVIGDLAGSGNNYRVRTRLINVSQGTSVIALDINVRDNAHIVRLLGTPAPVVATPAPAPAPAPAPVAAPAPAPVAAPAPAPAAPVTYRVGDRGPAGGFIFFDKGNNNDGWRYLEAAPADITARNGLIVATSEAINHQNNRERTVGTGRNNTAAIMEEARRLGGGFGWAAQLCDTFEVNGFSDWFLPSRDELNNMYGNLHVNGIGGFRGEWYWSSTSESANWWFAINFSNGNNETRSITSTQRVRPVRRF